MAGGDVKLRAALRRGDGERGHTAEIYSRRGLSHSSAAQHTPQFAPHTQNNYTGSLRRGSRGCKCVPLPAASGKLTCQGGIMKQRGGPEHTSSARVQAGKQGPLLTVAAVDRGGIAAVDFADVEGGRAHGLPIAGTLARGGGGTAVGAADLLQRGTPRRRAFPLHPAHFPTAFPLRHVSVCNGCTAASRVDIMT